MERDLEKEARTWAMLLHFSSLATYALPVIGLLAPIIIWQLKKNELPTIDEHGRNVANWLLSAFIYAIVSVVLTALIIGVPMLIALGVCTVVFPIIGGIKANDGVIWKYPLTITFF